MKRFRFIFYVFLFCICFSNVAYADEQYSFPDFKHLISDSSGKDKYYNIVIFDSQYVSWVDNTYYSLYVYDSLTDVPYSNGQRDGIGYVFDIGGSNVLGRDISWTRYDYTVGSSDGWVLDTSSLPFTVFGAGEGCIVNSNGVETIYSNFDITDSSGELCFFQHAPTISGAIVPMKTQTLSLIPDCLRYLVPCLIVLVVCSIGFRKAWSWLKLQLSI